ncbi:hypothetical protein J6590_065930 [Homalodisca vitripennis]|nr:hypothetical protein J6590_065930 [Homalodisca vitripennis]
MALLGSQTQTSPEDALEMAARGGLASSTISKANIWSLPEGRILAAHHSGRNSGLENEIRSILNNGVVCECGGHICVNLPSIVL